MTSTDPTYVPVGDQGYGVLGIEISLCGAILSFTLFGISLLQFYHVFRRLFDTSPTDRAINWKINLFLLSLLLFTDVADSVVKAIFTVTDVRKVILEGMNGILHVPPTAIGVPIADGFVALVVQCIYVRRLISITPFQNWFMKITSAFAILLAVLQFAFSVYTGVVLLQPENEWATKLNAPIITWLSLSPACDLLVTMSFIVHLRTHMKSSFDDTNFLVTRWIKFTLETGLISTIVQFLTLILWVSMPFSPWYSLPAWVISKVYINSILILFGTILSGGLKSGATMHGGSVNDSHNQTFQSMKQWNHGAVGPAALGRPSDVGSSYAYDRRVLPDNASAFGGSTLAGDTPSSYQTKFNMKNPPFASYGRKPAPPMPLDGVKVLTEMEQSVELSPVPQGHRIRPPKVDNLSLDEGSERSESPNEAV